jgi:hypothetical protein
MAHSVFISQNAWKQLGSAHAHRAWPLATVPQATPRAFSFYPHGKARPIAVNIAKLPELLRKAALDLALIGCVDPARLSQ